MKSTSDDEEQDLACCTGLMTSPKLRERHENSVDNVMRIVLLQWQAMKEHLRTHLSFRSWCQHCVSGRGVSAQHRRRTPGKNSVEVATVAADRCFFRNTPNEESIPELVVRDTETRQLSVHTVPMKGAVVEWIAQLFVILRGSNTIKDW